MRPGLSAIVAALSWVKARDMPHAANGQRHEMAPLQKRGKIVGTGLIGDLIGNPGSLSWYLHLAFVIQRHY